MKRNITVKIKEIEDYNCASKIWICDELRSDGDRTVVLRVLEDFYPTDLQIEEGQTFIVEVGSPVVGRDKNKDYRLVFLPSKVRCIDQIIKREEVVKVFIDTPNVRFFTLREVTPHLDRVSVLCERWVDRTTSIVMRVQDLTADQLEVDGNDIKGSLADAYLNFIRASSLMGEKWLPGEWSKKEENERI